MNINNKFTPNHNMNYSKNCGAKRMRLFQLISTTVFTLILSGTSYAYQLAGGDKQQADNAIAVINQYYQQSKAEDLRGYASLFVFVDEQQMSERLQLADSIWKMFDLTDYSVEVQEASVSPQGDTAIIRYIAKTTLKNTKGEQKQTANEMICLLYQIEGNWRIADVNFADGFMAGTDRMLIADGHDTFEPKASAKTQPATKPKKSPKPKVAPQPEKKPAKTDASNTKASKPKAKQVNKQSNAEMYEDTPNKVKFIRPQEMRIKKEDSKTRFINAGGSAYITYEPMAYERDGGNYTDSLTMCKYILGQMQENFQAKIIGKIEKVKVAGLSGHKVHFTWNMDGKPLEQIELALDGADKIFTLGILATPNMYKKYLPVFESAVNSFEYHGKIPAAKEQSAKPKTAEKEEKDTTLIAFPDRGSVTGILGKDPVAVVFNTEKTAKHIVQCNTMKQAPVILVMYDSKGNKVDTNYKNERLFKGFREDLKKGNGYFFYVIPYNDADIGKPFTVQVLTQ